MALYYIINGEAKEGPHDIVSIVRKIRSGKVTAETLIENTENEVVCPASQIGALEEFFTGDQLQTSRTSGGNIESFEFGNNFRYAVSEYMDFSGLSMVGILLLMALLAIAFGMSVILPGAFILFISGTLLGIIVMFLHALSAARQNSTRIAEAITIVVNAPNFLTFLAVCGIISALLLGLPMLLGLLIDPILFSLVILGYTFFGLFLFAPFIWVGENFIQPETALKKSVYMLKRQSADDLGLFLCMAAFQGVCVLLFYIPLIVSVPLSCFINYELYQFFMRKEAFQRDMQSSRVSN